MKKPPFFKFTDVLLLLFLIALPLYAILHRAQLHPSQKLAIVEIDGNTTYRVELDHPDKIILSRWDPPVIAEVRPGKIRIVQNDCLRQICVRTGFISQLGEMIVCVPKKILIYIQGENGPDSNGEIKAITG
jgi:hypothetical protein